MTPPKQRRIAMTASSAASSLRAGAPTPSPAA
jgi:hypothetical protein